MKANAPKPTVTPALTGTSAGTGIGSSNEFARFLQDQEKQLANSQKLLGNAEAANQLAKAKTEIERINIQFAKDVSDVLLKNQELIEKSKSIEEENNLLKLRSLELDTLALEKQAAIAELRDGALGSIQEEIKALEAKVAGLDDVYKRTKDIQDLVDAGGGSVTVGEATALVDRKKELEDLIAKQQELKDMATNVANTISGAFTNALRSVIDGSRSAEEALSDAFKNIGDAFIDMALQIIQQQLVLIANGLIMKALGVSMPSGGGFGSGASAPLTSGLDFSSAFAGRANGGPVAAGTPYIVGERQPELFVPNQAGNIYNQDQMRSAMSLYTPANESMAAVGQPMNINVQTTTINGTGIHYTRAVQRGDEANRKPCQQTGRATCNESPAPVTVNP